MAKKSIFFPPKILVNFSQFSQRYEVELQELLADRWEVCQFLSAGLGGWIELLAGPGTRPLISNCDWKPKSKNHIRARISNQRYHFFSSAPFGARYCVKYL